MAYFIVMEVKNDLYRWIAIADTPAEAIQKVRDSEGQAVQGRRLWAGEYKPIR